MQFETPFVWARIYPEDFMYLMNNFYTIDFGDIKIRHCGDVTKYHCLDVDKQSIAIQIQNNPYIFYNHYKYDPTALIPRVVTPDVFFYRNYEYAVKKYIERAKRMVSSTDPPIFIYHTNTTRNQPADRQFDIIDTPEIVQCLLDTARNCHCRLIVVTHFNVNVTIPENCVVVKIPSAYMPWETIIDLVWPHISSETKYECNK